MAQDGGLLVKDLAAARALSAGGGRLDGTWRPCQKNGLSDYAMGLVHGSPSPSAELKTEGK